MDGPGRRPFGRLDLDTVSDDGRAEAALAAGAEAREEGAFHRPVQGATEGLERQFGHRAAELADPALQRRLRLLQLGHVFRGQVAPGVDGVDGGVARLHRLLEILMGLGRGLLRQRHLGAPVLEVGERRALGGQRPAVRFHAHAIQRGDGGHATREAAERPRVVTGQQQLGVAAAAALVDGDQPLGHARGVRHALRLDARDPLGRRIALGGDRRQRRFGFGHALLRDGALEFELAQVVEDGAGRGRERRRPLAAARGSAPRLAPPSPSPRPAARSGRATSPGPSPATSPFRTPGPSGASCAQL